MKRKFKATEPFETCTSNKSRIVIRSKDLLGGNILFPKNEEQRNKEGVSEDDTFITELLEANLQPSTGNGDAPISEEYDPLAGVCLPDLDEDRIEDMLWSPEFLALADDVTENRNEEEERLLNSTLSVCDRIAVEKPVAIPTALETKVRERLCVGPVVSEEKPTYPQLELNLDEDSKTEEEKFIETALSIIDGLETENPPVLPNVIEAKDNKKLEAFLFEQRANIDQLELKKVSNRVNTKTVNLNSSNRDDVRGIVITSEKEKPKYYKVLRNGILRCEICHVPFNHHRTLSNHLKSHGLYMQVPNPLFSATNRMNSKDESKGTYRWCSEYKIKLDEPAVPQKTENNNQKFNMEIQCQTFNCEICQTPFATHRTFTQHMKTHGIILVNKYSCTNCNKQFFQKSYLDNHIARKHKQMLGKKEDEEERSHLSAITIEEDHEDNGSTKYITIHTKFKEVDQKENEESSDFNPPYSGNIW